MQRDELDYIVIGSGFGGSVSALRLTEKGYKVVVLEKGREFKDKDFPKTNWNTPKYLWAPFFKCFGIQQLSWFKDVLILSGTGVGGGSLVYANTLMTPPKEFFKNKVWSNLNNWEEALAPFYDTAKRMLGVVKNPWEHKADQLLKEIAADIGKDDSFENVNVGVYFNDDSQSEEDPYFNGHGPKRKGCIACGGCMVGCRHNAKNTLVKNYLYFARKFGAKVFAKRYVTKIEEKSGTYFVHTRKTGAWFFKDHKIFKSKGIIFSGGVLGTMKILLEQKYKYKTLSNISDRIGDNIRTNSEMLCGVTSDNLDLKLNDGVAISSILNPDENTHIEIVKYPTGSDFMKHLAFPFVKYSPFPFRLFHSVLQFILHPVKLFRTYFVGSYSDRSIIFLVMQNLDSSMKMKLNKLPFMSLSLKNNSKDKVPSYIPEGVDIMKRFEQKVNGVSQSIVVEALFNKPATAHILGGASMGEDINSGVVSPEFKVFGYDNMYVFDGSIVPCNIGVNPSLTIAALTEYGMSKIPRKEGSNYYSLDKLMN